MAEKKTANPVKYSPTSEQAQGVDAQPVSEASVEAAATLESKKLSTRPKEIGGRNGPEPTRFGDWEKNGRCIDF
ncbi:MAG: DUF1674 domain-containing protein [Pseudomonadota bacterium]